MNNIVTISLVVNILVLLPVCSGIINGAKWVPAVYGFDQPSLRILVCVYIAILVSSVLLLLWPNMYFVFALLAVQVIYKLLTPFIVGNPLNPVVLSNLGIAILHCVSLYTIYSSPNFILKLYM